MSLGFLGHSRGAAGAVVLGAAALAGTPLLAHAQPPVRFAVQGGCPSQDQLVAALGSQVAAAAPEQRAWSVEVESVDDRRATLLLRTPEGEVSTERTIESADCHALAQAFALIVLAQFAELRLLSTAPSPAPAPAPAAPPRPARRVTTTAESPRAPALALDVAALAGLELGMAPGSAAPAAGLSLGLGPATDLPAPNCCWLARLDTRVAAAVRAENATDRVERWTSAARLELGWRFRLGAAAWLAGTAGGGVTLARVTALDLDTTPSALRVWPALSVAALLGLPLGTRWALRIQSAASLYPRVDRYRVEPEGIVARSPRVELMAGVGLEFRAPL